MDLIWKMLMCWRFFTFPCVGFPMPFSKCLSNTLEHHSAQGSPTARSPSRRCCHTDTEQLILSFENLIKDFQRVLSWPCEFRGTVGESVCLFSLRCFVSNPGLWAVFPRFPWEAPVPWCIILWLSPAVLTSYQISHATFFPTQKKTEWLLSNVSIHTMRRKKSMDYI